MDQDLSLVSTQDLMAALLDRFDVVVIGLHRHGGQITPQTRLVSSKGNWLETTGLASYIENRLHAQWANEKIDIPPDDA